MVSEIFILSLCVTTVHLVLSKYNIESKWLNWSKRPVAGYCELCISFWLGACLLAPVEYYMNSSFGFEFLIVIVAQPTLTMVLSGFSLR